MENVTIKEFYRSSLGIVKESTLDMLAENTKIRRRKKGDRLLTAGDKMTVLQFILTGIARAYVVDDEGHEVVMGFYKDHGSPFTGATGVQDRIMFNVEAVTDMETLELPVAIALYAMKQDQACTEIYHKMLIDNHNADIEWQIARQTKKGKDRYLWFLKEYADIARYVTQKDIASFLGIQPPSLSRLKAELEREKR